MRRRRSRGGRRGTVAVAMAAALLPTAASGPAVAPPAAGASASTALLGADLPRQHEGAEGFLLTAASGDGGAAGGACDPAAPVREYRVAAIDVDVTLNRYLDHDPQGRMYVHEQDLARVRAEEAANARARSSGTEPAVSSGLGDDAIQPLTLRVRQGECLRITLRNALTAGEPASIHVHGASLMVRGAGPAIATDPAAVVRPGGTVTYEWMVAAGEPEGTHYFHSHGDDRFQTDHGLFGAVIVEPAGAVWLDPATGRPERTGWQAMVQPPRGAAFREFVLYYHEVGDEAYQVRDAAGAFVPLVDPVTTAYRPDGRALDYRSEPFMNRLALGRKTTGQVDESLEYSSYAFGDPATPIMRSYLGDPVKQRLVHAGAEVFHVHHVHGGGIRWLRQPDTEPTTFDSGLDKHPALHPLASERTDSQTIGPSETYDIADECGSGGCQQSAGDFMYHCHVTQHYFAGMWGVWRVYDTRQGTASPTDGLGPLAELPGRVDGVADAVTSDQLVGRTVSTYGVATAIDGGTLAAWVERQLPPPGLPRGYDASVLDWRRDGLRYLGEPETSSSWPAYRPRAPGSRPALLFDPRTGRLAYPFLQPHLGRRPPFAPDHGPAPFLEPIRSGTDPPAPGANGPASVCPSGTRPRSFAIDAVALPLPLSGSQDIVDPRGEVYVLRDQEAAARADPALRGPLVIRADAGEDCVDVVLRNELADTADDPFDKVGVHIHFAQFDVQASDGVDTGFNYEQTVRPYRLAGEQLVALAPAGAQTIPVGSVTRFQAGEAIGVGMEQDASFETHRVAAVSAGRLSLDTPLRSAHAPGEIVSTEFVRYRWYPDVQFGTAFFHDHTNVIYSSRHGLFGALIAEPPGSTFTDPHTGAPLESGLTADVHTRGGVSVDVSGSFREVALELQDDNPLTAVGRSTGSSVDLRVEPVEQRTRDPSRAFSSSAAGDPGTPIIEARLGDPVVVRALVGASNEVHTLHVDGHWFRAEPWSASSPPVDTVDIGISERYDLVIPAAGGPQGMPGDYLYSNGRSFALREGSWGILRVDGPGEGSGLQPLPGHERIPAPATALCPTGAPHRHVAVDAVDTPLPMLGGQPGKVYVLAADRDALLAGRRPPAPLVLHADVGDCLDVDLANATRGGPVSFHADMLAFDPRLSGGVEAGRDPPQAVAPGTSRRYTVYASPAVGPTVAMVRDLGDPLHNPGLGLYGAIVVGPAGTRYTDPHTGASVDGASAWAVDAHPPTGPAYRDDAVFLQDDDASLGTHLMPYREQVDGIVGLSYTTEPLAPRLVGNPDSAAVFRSDVHGDPATPVVEAYAGDAVRLRVLVPWSEQEQVVSIEGHTWPQEPGRRGTRVTSAVAVGGLDARTLAITAGGEARAPGDYLYGDHRGPYQQAGLWGIVRVLGCDSRGVALRPLGAANGPVATSCETGPGTGGVGPGSVAGGVAGSLGLLAGVWLLLRRRRRRGPGRGRGPGPGPGPGRGEDASQG